MIRNLSKELEKELTLVQRMAESLTVVANIKVRVLGKYWELTRTYRITKARATMEANKIT